MKQYQIFLIIFALGCVVSAIVTSKIWSELRQKSISSLSFQNQANEQRFNNALSESNREKSELQRKIGDLNNQITAYETEIDNLQAALKHREELEEKNEKDLLVEIHERLIKATEPNIDDIKQDRFQKKIEEAINNINWTETIREGLKEVFSNASFCETVAEGIVNDHSFSEAIRAASTLDEDDVEEAVTRAFYNHQLSTLSSDDIEEAVESALQLHDFSDSSLPGYDIESAVEKALSNYNFNDISVSDVEDAIRNQLYNIEDTIESAVRNAML